MKKNKGFTLVELLVVLVIVGILAAIATPLYIAHTRKARAAEAVATMGLIRQAERDFRVNRNLYVEVATDNIQDALPGATLAAATDGLEVNAGVSQYFSNASFTVDTSAPAFTAPAALVGNPTSPVDFLITAEGSLTNAVCTAADTNCAVRGTDVDGNGGAAGGANVYRLEMDNSGRTFVCYTTCGTAANWSIY